VFCMGVGNGNLRTVGVAMVGLARAEFVCTCGTCESRGRKRKCVGSRGECVSGWICRCGFVFGKSGGGFFKGWNFEVQIDTTKFSAKAS
jgi:hypothetical protein